MSDMNAEAGRSTTAGQPKKSRAGIFSWMLFDWAAQPFFTVIITFIFGPYFVSRLAQDAATGQAAWGYTITVSGIIVAVLAPMLGSVADATGTRKPWIAVFALIKIITLMLPWFGLDAAQGEDARITGPFSALWYLIFILPMFLFTPDGGKGLPLKKAVKSGLVELKNTLVELKQRAGVLRFFIARMIYQDGVNGLLALGGTFAAGMFGWQTMEMGIYGILLLIVAIGGCLVASWLDAHLGSKRLVLLSLICLVTACVGIISTGPGYTLFGWVQLASQDSGALFGTAAEKAYILFGLLIGIAFGPVQASSRSYLARSVSPEEAGRYFGIYALSGRVTSFLAPMSVATLTLYTDSARVGMSALVVFLLVGLLMLWVTPYPANRR